MYFACFGNGHTDRSCVITRTFLHFILVIEMIMFYYGVTKMKVLKVRKYCLLLSLLKFSSIKLILLILTAIRREQSVHVSNFRQKCPKLININNFTYNLG